MVLSKPPGPTVAAEIRALPMRTPTRFALLGPGAPDLTTAVTQVLAGTARRYRLAGLAEPADAAPRLSTRLVLRRHTVR